jgi:hypothetical protein
MYGKLVKQREREREREREDATFGGTWQGGMRGVRWASLTGLPDKAKYFLSFFFSLLLLFK